MTYTITLLSLFVLAIITRPIKPLQKRIFFCICSFLLLALLSGFRYQNEYSDFQVNYRRVIQAASQTWGEAFRYSEDIFHQCFRKIVGTIFKDPQAYFVIAALFIVGMNILCFYKYADNIFLCLLLYYCEFGYFNANNMTRQSIAVGITIIAWTFLLERKNVKFWLTMLIATLFHTSVLFFVPLFFLARINFTKKNIFVYSLLGLLIVIFYNPISNIAQRFLYSEYVETSYGMTSSNILRLSLAVVCGIMLYIYTIRKENGYVDLKSKEKIAGSNFDNFILNGTFIFIICTILSSIRVLMFSRVALYFAPCAIIGIDKSLGRVQNNRTKKIIYSVIVVFMVAWFAAMNYYGKLIPTPYTPFWSFPSRPKI